MQCNRCGSLTFGGFCPVCGFNFIKIRMPNNRMMFSSNQWVEEKLNWRKLRDNKGQINPNKLGIKNKAPLDINNNFIKTSGNPILEHFQEKGISSRNLASRVSINQKLHVDWVREINEDSNFIESISPEIKENDPREVIKEKIKKSKKKDIDDLILK